MSKYEITEEDYKKLIERMTNFYLIVLALGMLIGGLIAGAL